MNTASSHSSRLPYTAPTVVAVACILAVMVGTLVSACDSSGSNGGSADVLIPVETGNRWEADVSTAGQFHSTALFEVVSKTEIKIQETFSDGGTETETLKVEQRSDDGITIKYLYNTGDAPVMELKYPADEGTTYEHTDGSGATYEVSVKRETIQVPAGEYDCILYEIRDARDGDLETEIWIKPGMGPVRYVDDGGEEVWELVSSNVDS